MAPTLCQEIISIDIITHKPIKDSDYQRSTQRIELTNLPDKKGDRDPASLEIVWRVRWNSIVHRRAVEFLSQLEVSMLNFRRPVFRAFKL